GIDNDAIDRFCRTLRGAVGERLACAAVCRIEQRPHLVRRRRGGGHDHFSCGSVWGRACNDAGGHARGRPFEPDTPGGPAPDSACILHNRFPFTTLRGTEACLPVAAAV